MGGRRSCGFVVLCFGFGAVWCLSFVGWGFVTFLHAWQGFLGLFVSLRLGFPVDGR